MTDDTDTDYSDRYSLPEPIRINRERNARRWEGLCLLALPTLVGLIFLYAVAVILGAYP